jgi:hypothetical protein
MQLDDQQASSNVEESVVRFFATLEARTRILPC